MLIDYIMEQGELSADHAKKVLDFYEREKLLKFDPHIGKLTFIHGMLGDKEVLKRAAVLNKYRVKFYGKKAGSIGKSVLRTETVYAEDVQAAGLKLYENFEHVEIVEAKIV